MKLLWRWKIVRLTASDEQVEAACLGYWPLHWPQNFDKKDADSIRGHMRKAIEAAIKKG